MVATRQLIIINVALALVSVVLLLYLFDAPLFSTGAAFSEPRSDATCAVVSEGQRVALNDLDRCCYHARSQLSCETSVSGVWQCFTPGVSLTYELSDSAYRYCRGQLGWQ